MQLIDRARRRAHRLGAAGSTSAGRVAEDAERWTVVPASEQDDAGLGAPREDADPDLDVAVYTCSCGYVFEAAVSTGVGCPHCGDRQAW